MQLGSGTSTSIRVKKFAQNSFSSSFSLDSKSSSITAIATDLS
jgi:hypothetical protein